VVSTRQEKFAIVKLGAAAASRHSTKSNRQISQAVHCKLLLKAANIALLTYATALEKLPRALVVALPRPGAGSRGRLERIINSF
jgi:hypothetical protein